MLYRHRPRLQHLLGRTFPARQDNDMPKDPLVLQAMGIPPEAVATTMATTPQAAVQSHLPLRLLSEQPVMHRANIDRNPERVSLSSHPMCSQ